MKLKKLILHIGVHKTGSTAIQSFLYKNNDLLNNQGFYMPDYLYCAEYKPADLRYSIIKKDANLTRFHLKSIVENAKKRNCDTVIISDEDYCKANEHDLSNVKIFSEFFEEVEVLIYCRRPDTQSESGYAFCVMWKTSKYSQSPEQWYSNNPGKNYLFIADFYNNMIDRCNINLVSYDFNSKRLIDSFIEACGITEVQFKMPKRNESNISANKYMVEIMNEINKYQLNDRLFLLIKEYVLHHKELQDGPKAIFFSDESRAENQALVENANRQFIDKYNNGKELFDALVPMEVPAGLDEKRKQTIIDEIVKRYHLKGKKEEQSIVRFTETLKTSRSIENTDIFREIALLCESLTLYDAAYTLMKLAQLSRPHGPTINRKIVDIKEKYQSSNNKSSDLGCIIKLIDTAYFKYSKVKSDTESLRKKLKISRKVKDCDVNREIGMLCEWYGEIHAAYYFMMLSKRERPNGKTIENKCRKYRNIIDPVVPGKRPMVYVHMGANKTATTSIQCSLSVNRDLLASLNDGYFFNKFWRVNSSRMFKHLCVKHYDISTEHIKNGHYTSTNNNNYHHELLDGLMKEMKNFEGYNYIFSGEDIYPFSFKKMNRLREFLKLLIPNCEIKVIFTVRNFVSYINSFMQESSKGGALKYKYIIYKLRPSYLFVQPIKRMRNVFGAENVAVYSFEDSLQHRFGPVGMFLNTIGMKSADVEKFNIVRKNESLSDRAVYLMFWANSKIFKFNEYTWENRRKIRKMYKPLSTIKGEYKYTEKNMVLRLFYSVMKKEAQWLKRVYGIDYTDYRNKTKDKRVMFDDEFIQDITTIFDDLKPIMQCIAYLCFVDKSKSLFLDGVSRKTFKKLVGWCEENYPETSNKNYDCNLDKIQTNEKLWDNL